MFLFNLSSTKTPSKSGIPGVPNVSILVQKILGVIDLTFFQKVDSFPRFVVELFFFPLPLSDCFSRFDNANFVSLDNNKSDSKFFLLWFKFVARTSDCFAIYNPSPSRCLDIKVSCSSVCRIDNNNINWALFADVSKYVVALFKKFVYRFV